MQNIQSSLSYIQSSFNFLIEFTFTLHLIVQQRSQFHLIYTNVNTLEFISKFYKSTYILRLKMWLETLKFLITL